MQHTDGHVDERDRGGDRDRAGDVVPVLCATTLALTALAALIWLWAESVPGGHFLIRVGLALGGLVLGFVGCCLAAYVGARRVWGPGVRGGVALLATAGVVLATAALTAGHVPLRLRFELSRGAFDEVAAEGRAAVDAASADELADVFDGARDRSLPVDVDRRVGWYDVAHAGVEADGVSIGMLGSWGGTCGFVHAPGGRPGWLSGASVEVSSLALGGGWYAYWTGFD